MCKAFEYVIRGKMFKVIENSKEKLTLLSETYTYKRESVLFKKSQTVKYSKIIVITINKHNGCVEVEFTNYNPDYYYDKDLNTKKENALKEEVKELIKKGEIKLC